MLCSFLASKRKVAVQDQLTQLKYAVGGLFFKLFGRAVISERRLACVSCDKHVPVHSLFTFACVGFVGGTDWFRRWRLSLRRSIGKRTLPTSRLVCAMCALIAV